MELRLRSKMKQKSNIESTDAQVIEKLAFRDRRKKLRSFDLDRDSALNQHVDTEESDFDPSIQDLDRYLHARTQPVTR